MSCDRFSIRNQCILVRPRKYDDDDHGEKEGRNLNSGLALEPRVITVQTMDTACELSDYSIDENCYNNKIYNTIIETRS